MSELQRVMKEIRGEMRYCVVGPKGGVDFHFQDLTDRFPEVGVCAGLEIHRREPADAQRDRPANVDQCWLLDGPCWCDGSSLYAIETLYPMFKALGVEGFWPVLEHEYRNQFEPAESR